MVKIRNEKGFTLIEMLIVLAVITTLLILLIPNLADKNETVQNKGCAALIQMTDNQLESYKIDHGAYPATISILVDEEYIQSDTCSNGTKQIVYDEGEAINHKLKTIAVTK
ncbi:competence type IV pilus major pilin ComGC [Paraliobacillus sediminis]|uniref:competence type IV pilus major pilin ComGC n=1 Tax=Paraliobacillus sediminis TaxID=1885916 RepID=UPI000E3C07BC|nr:competence type IV pilus major pilin ComGC [Paraliobacillus sediminis]